MRVVPLVGNEEVLYRSVRPDPENFKFKDGKLILSTQAFGDRAKRPSLFRHDFCESPPHNNPPRMGRDQLVVPLKAEQIREGDLQLKNGAATRLVDVERDLFRQHMSHCVVVANPAIGLDEEKVFRRLKEKLTRLSSDHLNWVIGPSDELIEKIKNRDQ